MNDIITRKLNEAKKQLADLERKANKPEPSPNRTVDLSVGLPELPPQNFESDPYIPGIIKPGPKMSNKFKQV
tara:strand:+ start:627 stop:842 length:216 start_codon:yes stop_codon:yes gene_type:complete